MLSIFLQPIQLDQQTAQVCGNPAQPPWDTRQKVMLKIAAMPLWNHVDLALQQSFPTAQLAAPQPILSHATEV